MFLNLGNNFCSELHTFKKDMRTDDSYFTFIVNGIDDDSISYDIESVIDTYCNYTRRALMEEENLVYLPDANEYDECGFFHVKMMENALCFLEGLNFHIFNYLNNLTAEIDSSKWESIFYRVIHYEKNLVFNKKLEEKFDSDDIAKFRKAISVIFMEKKLERND